jgi:hypothetical protein
MFFKKVWNFENIITPNKRLKIDFSSIETTHDLKTIESIEREPNIPSII